MMPASEIPAAADTARESTTRAAPDKRLAAAFAHHVARWAQEQGASPAVRELVRHAARAVSQATSDGHSCLALDQLIESLDADGIMPADRADLRARLLASKVVGTPDAPDALPLILDDERLYLHRYYDYECRLAASLAARCTARSIVVENTPAPRVVALLDRVFAANAPQSAGLRSAALPTDPPDWQKIAALTALLGRLTIVSGGPGTGKTTTVVNLLACLLEADPGCRIALTAPTGKAAARLTEVILQRSGHLPDALRARLPNESSTIHRLLGSMPNGEFRHHAGNLLPIDVLVVDEASMLDLALAVHLIEAVPDEARIVLLGDKDQLAAVESGAVFSELSTQPRFSAARIQALCRFAGVAAQALQPAPLDPLPPDAATQPRGLLDDSIVWLRRNYRFGSGSAIGLLAADVNAGNTVRVLDRLCARSDDSLVWLDEVGSEPSRACLHAIQAWITSYTEALRRHPIDPGVVAAAFGRFRVLCALRDGPWGVTALNQQIGTQVRRTLQHPLDPGLRSDWYPGHPVMVLRNDPVLKLFNGDVGWVLPDRQSTLQVYFPAEAGGFRAIPPVRLPEHETAYAMTVHKSQGSEFDDVLLVLPAENNRVLTCELLYTAVTRARQRLTIAANTNVLSATIETATKRLSGLSARLREQSNRR